MVMKSKFLLVILMFLPGLMQAQNLSWRSNDIHLNLQTPVVSAGIPQIQWVQPALDYMSSPLGKVNLNAIVTSPAELTEVRLVLVNSKTGEQQGAKIYSDVKGNRYVIDHSITLVDDGTYYIEVTAVNATRATVSDRRNLVVGKDALDYISADRKDYALIFATNTYDHFDDLTNPVYDGETIAQELKERYGFEAEVVLNAEYDQVFEKIREYNERRFNPQDQLLVFFAGHGMFDDTFGEGYVVASNSLANDKSRTTYISHARLRGIIDNIPCQHILLMMDVCFGGTLDPVIARARSAAYEVSEREMLARKLSYKTRKYLTSGGKEYVPDGTPGAHSPFAAKFIESLRSMGGSDRILTLAEIQMSLEKLKLLPRFGSFGGDETLSDFVFVAKSN